MPRKSTLIVCGTASLDQVNELVRLGVPRDKAIMYSNEQAGRRIRKLKRKRKPSLSSTTRPNSRQQPQTRLLVKEIWPRITSLARKYSDRAAIAVAFFAKNASKQLPLGKGSILVVNLSEATLAAGLTNPYELERLLHKGVEIYNNPKLHAKVFVFPGRAVVGSNNASHSSANELLEAAIEVSAEGTVAACKKYVKSLCQGPPLGPEYLEDLKALYHPPKSIAPTPQVPDTGNESSLRLWAVCVREEEYDQYDKAAESRGMPLAEAELSADESSSELAYDESSSELAYIDTFWTDAAIFRRNVKLHDIISQVIVEDGTRFAYPPSRVVHLEKYTKGDGAKCVMIFLEAFVGKEPIVLDTVIWQLKVQKKCPNAMMLRSVKTAKKIADQRLQEQFLNLWV